VSVAVCLAGACDSRIRNISARSQSHGHRRPMAQDLAGIEGRNKKAESSWVAPRLKESWPKVTKGAKGRSWPEALQKRRPPGDNNTVAETSAFPRHPLAPLHFLRLHLFYGFAFFSKARLDGHSFLELNCVRERLRQAPSRLDDAFERRVEPTISEAQPAVASPRWVSPRFSDGFPTSIPRSSPR
jgi:hypothetical protein